MHACVHARSLQLCTTLCDPLDYSPKGSSVHRILQARILEWVAMPSSRGSSPGIKPVSLVTPALVGRFFNTESLGKPQQTIILSFIYGPSPSTRIVSSMGVGILTVLFTAVSLVSRAVPSTQWVFSKSLLDE